MLETIIVISLVIGLMYIFGANSKNPNSHETSGSQKENPRLHEAVTVSEMMEQAFREHKDTLRRKMKILVKIDDYGFEDRSAWENEKKYLIQKICTRNICPTFWDEYDRELEDALSMSNIDVTPEWANAFFPDDPSKAEGYIRNFKGQHEELLERGLPSYLDGFRDKIDMWLQTEQDDTDSDYKETLSGLEYESYCAGLLDKSGWNTRMTPQTGDQGVDIVASKSNTTIVIQCKKSASPIGNKAIQEVVAGMGYMNADGACVVTNSTFTKSAIELATANNVRLLHHDELSLLSPHVFRKN